MSDHSAKSANPFDASKVATPATTYSASRWALFLVPAVFGVAADLVSKWWMFSQVPLRQGEIYWVVPNYAGFQLSLNEGALFGMGQGYVWLFALFGVGAACAVPVWLFRFGAANDAWITFALGCIMAGVLGNLYDRMALHGETWFYDPSRARETAYAVRDFILLQWGPEYRWPNFNLADSFLVVGAGVVLVKALFEKPAGEPAADSTNS